MKSLTTQTTFKPTFLQKLLGRNYKWWYVIQYNFKSASAYATSDIFYYLNQIITAYVSIGIWSLSNRGDIDQTINYLIVGNIFLSLTLLNNHWRLSDEVYSGGFSSKYILPIDLFKYYFFNAISYMSKVSIVILFYLPLFLIFNQFLTFSWLAFGLFILSYPIALFIKFLFNHIIGCSVFWLTNSDGALSFSETVVTLLSGSLIPLGILNQNLLYFTPFAFMLHHPMQIYLGKYDSTQTLLVFAGGIAWCIILYFLAKSVFKLGLKRNEAVGL